MTKEMLSWRVDKSGIPPGKLVDARLKDVERSLCAQVNDVHIRWRTCLHEAAHIFYARKAGLTHCLFGPAILYDERTDSFGSSLGAVRPIFPQKQPPECTEQAVAKMHVAGSVAERALAGRGNAESGSMDFDAFRERFRDEWSKEEILREWEEAKKAVERDLESPAVKREIRALALELELEGKLFDYSFVVENAVQKDGKG